MDDAVRPQSRAVATRSGRADAPAASVRQPFLTPREAAAAPREAYAARRERRTLPAWPLTALFGFYPLWWVLGVVDVIWIVFGLVLSFLLVRAGAVRLPLGIGVWLMFLLWALASIIELPTPSSVIAFSYRYLIYVACTVLLVYVFNARKRLTERYVSGVMTVFWVVTVVGGYLGVLLPAVRFQTVLAHAFAVPRIGDLVPSLILQNQLVRQMIVRPFAQFNPNAYTVIAPRPSAPFLYTNNWGNAYSLLIPFVVIYLMHVRQQRGRFWLLVAVLVASVVPAFLTLNRGMFFGLALSLVYVAVRFALMGRTRGLFVVAAVGVLAAAAFVLLPVQDRLDQRLETNSSTVTRASLYQQVLSSVPDSPIFGQGGPRPSTNRYAPPVGTQGQIWLVLFSHGVGGAVLFVGWFGVTFLLTIRRRDAAGIAWNTVILVSTVELLYYGVIPSGLPVIMVAAALGLRGPDATTSTTSGIPSTSSRRTRGAVESVRGSAVASAR